MPSLFQMLDDAAATDDPPQPLEEPSLKREPTYQLHDCIHPGCYKWGCNGFMPQGIETSQWWCTDHTPDWFRRPWKEVARGA